MMKLCGWSYVLEKTSIYIEPLVDDEGHVLSYTLTGLPDGIDVVYVEVAADGREPGAYLQGYIAYSNVASNAPPVDFQVTINIASTVNSENPETKSFVWTISDVNRLSGLLTNLVGNEGQSVKIMLPKVDEGYGSLQWYVVVGLPPGLNYDFYYGAIVGRIDYSAVSDDELTRNYIVTVEFHDVDSIDRSSFIWTVHNQVPTEGDDGLGIVTYFDRELEIYAGVSETGDLVVSNGVAFVLALNKMPLSPVRVNIGGGASPYGPVLEFRVHSPDSYYDDAPWSEQLELTLDGSNWQSGFIIEVRLSPVGSNLPERALLPIQLTPNPFCGLISEGFVGVAVVRAFVSATDATFWQKLAYQILQDAQFKQGLLRIRNQGIENDPSVIKDLALTWNKAITARYADGFTEFRSIAQLSSATKASEAFNDKYSWYGLAAFASQAVGNAIAMIHLALPHGPADFEKRIITHMMNVFHAGNKFVYADTYWQLLAYRYGGLDLVTRLVPFAGLRQAWRSLDGGQLDEGVSIMVSHEQVALQRIVFDPVIRFRRQVISPGALGGGGGAFTLTLMLVKKISWPATLIGTTIGAPIGGGTAWAILNRIESALSVRLWSAHANCRIPAAPAPNFVDILHWEDQTATMDRRRFVFGPDWGKPGGTLKGLVGTWLDIVDRASGKPGKRTIPNDDPSKAQALEWIKGQMIMFKRRT
jgi:hypothetical protein